MSLASKIRAAWGEDAPMMGGHSRLSGVLSTGIDSLNVALGTGGYPVGRITFLHGGEASGKTNMTLLAVKQAQLRGGAALFLDFEQKLEGRWAEALGVNLDDVFLEHPESIEQGLEIAVDFVEQLRAQDKDAPAIVIWDSLHSAEAAKTARGELTSGNFGNESQAYSRGFRRIARTIREKKVVFIAISQVRMAIDSMGNAKEKVGVGRATLHAAAVIVGLKSKEIRPPGKDPYFEVSAFLKPPKGKNQVATGFPETSWAFFPGHGIHEGQSLLHAALLVDIAKGPLPGGWYEISIPRQKPVKVKGEFSLEQKKPAFLDALRKAVYSKLTVTVNAEAPADVAPDTNEEDEE